MPVKLSDIRHALESYARTKLILDLRAAEPSVHTAPGTTFAMTFRAANAVPAGGGLRVTGLVWHVWLEGGDNTVALVVPATPGRATDGLDGARSLMAGSLVTSMYLRFPPGHACHALDPGARAVVHVDAVLGTAARRADQTTVCFRLYASVDLEWLFPREVASDIAQHAV